jgi:hypothetical protein
LGGQEEQGIYEKEETEMEDPEAEEPGAVPVIDPLNDPEDEEELTEEDPGTEGSPAGAEETMKAAAEDEEQPQEIPPVKEGLKKPAPESYSGGSNHSTALIEQFLNSEPGVIKADKETSLEGDVSVGSVQEDDGFITDTLARIYIKQGLHAKAIYAYERLSLKYPEKSAYFAAQIEKIKSITNI